MSARSRGRIAVTMVCAVTAGLASYAGPAAATPVCTDGYMGGPPKAACGGRIFPEAALTRAYVQYTADPRGFKEYEHGLEYLAKSYPGFVEYTTLDKLYGPDAVSAGPDKLRSYAANDTGDGRNIPVLKVTDESVPDKGKKALFFSLSVHGPERGGLEGGVRTAEDLAIAATSGGAIVDGIDNYTSTTGRKPVFNEYQVRDVLKKEVVYFVNFNPDGWAIGDLWTIPTNLFGRGNSIGTDLNRQMPTIGSINSSRSPLEESETKYGWELMKDVAKDSEGGRMGHAADIHGELTSQAYVDIMYPAGQFSSVDHRRLMAIAERTKSVIDDTLYAGIQDEIEANSGGNDSESDQDIPTKPAHWATVWDTLGYTDTGFIGDYMATDLAVTGMDYEFFLNHQVPDKVWNVYLQENHINGSRALIKTAMAYTLTQEKEFNDKNVLVETDGRAGYVFNPDPVTDSDANGPGTLPGPKKDGIGANGQPVEQRPYSATNMQFFRDEGKLTPKPFVKLASGDVARDASALDAVDTLVLADVALPRDAEDRSVDREAYFANLRDWVKRGGNLILTDQAVKSLADLGVVAADKIRDIKVYQPYANITDFTNPLVKGLRPNARQLVEAAVLGYGIGNNASPMTIVEKAAFEAAGGKTVATTGNNTGSSDSATQTSIGEIKLGDGVIRVLGAALPTPSEALDHRYGLRDYALTYTGLFIMENALKYDAAGLGSAGCVSKARRGARSKRAGAKVARVCGTRRASVRRASARRR